MKIILVESKTQLRQFCEFTIQHYKHAEHYVHPLQVSLQTLLDFEKNPFWRDKSFAFYLLLDHQHRCIGRIAAFSKISTKRGQAYFGFYECINDPIAARCLLQAAMQFAKKNDCISLAGPYNPSINYELGVLVNGFDRSPFFMMTYNYSYYNQQLLNEGFMTDQDYYSYILPPAMFRYTEKFNSVLCKVVAIADIHVRNVNMGDLKNEYNLLFDIYNDAFSAHHGFVAFGKEEFQYMAKDMAKIVLPDFLKIIFYRGEAVGFILALPNLNQVLKKIKNGRLLPFGWIRWLNRKKYIKQTRVLNVAVKQAYQHMGFGAILYKAIYEEMLKHQFDVGQLSWVAESNYGMRKIIEQLGAKKENTYRVYIKQLQ